MNFEVSVVAIRRKMGKRKVSDFWDFWIILFAVVVNIFNDWAFPTWLYMSGGLEGFPLRILPNNQPQSMNHVGLFNSCDQIVYLQQVSHLQISFLKCSSRCILLSVTHLIYNTGNSRNRKTILQKQKIKLRINFLFDLIAGYPIRAEQN